MPCFAVAVPAAMLLGALGPVSPVDAAKKEVQYRDDKLTASLEGVPLSEVLAELARQSGAEVGAADIATFARARCHHCAEDFVRHISRATSDPELRAQAQAVLHQLKRDPCKGPKPVEGSAQAATR